MTNKYCIIKTTFNSKKDAKNLAKILLDKRLIACAEIKEIESWYFWNNKIENNKEF